MVRIYKKRKWCNGRGFTYLLSLTLHFDALSTLFNEHICIRPLLGSELQVVVLQPDGRFLHHKLPHIFVLLEVFPEKGDHNKCG